jgi:hypothetical protein
MDFILKNSAGSYCKDARQEHLTYLAEGEENHCEINLETSP